MVLLPQVTGYSETGKDVLSDIKDNRIPNVHAWRDEVRAVNKGCAGQSQEITVKCAAIYGAADAVPAVPAVSYFAVIEQSWQ
jgi:hypothetical protein